MHATNQTDSYRMLIHPGPGIIPARLNAQGDILLGDLIIAIDDADIQSFDNLFVALDRHKVGDTVTVTLQRNGEQVQLEVTLEAI